MVDLNNNKRPVVAATLAGVLAIMIVGAGFMTGKFEAIKPVDKSVDSTPVISKMVSSVSTSADKQIDLYKEKQELEEQAAVASNLSDKDEDGAKATDKKDNSKSKSDSDYLNYRASNEVSVGYLADKYGVSRDEIAKMNGVEPNHKFKDGDVILIPILKDPSIDGNG